MTKRQKVLLTRQQRQGRLSSALRHLGLLSLLFIVALVVAGISTSVLLTQPAGAIGDPGLDAKIITNPGIGWTPYQLPAATRTALTGRLTTGGPLSGAKAAVEYWRSSQGSALGIMLAQGEGLQSNVSAQQVPTLEFICGASTQTSPVPGLPNALSASCSTQSADGPLPVNIIVDSKGPILMMVFTVGPYPVDATGSIVSIAMTQFDGLPASSTNVTTIVLYGLGVLVLVMAVIVYIFQRAKKLEQAAERSAGLTAGPAFVGYDPFAQGTPASNYSQQSPISGAGYHLGMPSTFQPSTVQPSTVLSNITEVPLAPFNPTPLSGPLSGPLSAPQSPSGSDLSLTNSTDQVSENITNATPLNAEPQGLTVGWHADPANPHVQNYWDGSTWSHQMSWNGTSWA